MNPKRINDVLYWGACALLAGVVVYCMMTPVLSILRSVPLDPNEGWNAYFGDAAIDGGVLYPSADALITNNYPPLSFYVVGALGRLFGDNIFAGRFVALFSLLFVTWSIYYWLRMSGSAARVGILAALTFLAFGVSYGRDYVAMNDPQWLAHALMMSGLLVLWKDKEDTRHIIMSAILMTAAGCTKHLLIPLPISVSLWLLWHSRAAFFKWIVSAALALELAASLVWWLHGVRAFASLNEPRQWMRWKAIATSTAALECFAPLLVIWIAAIAKGRMNARLGFVSVYVLISGAVSVLAEGGAGVDVNAFFDLLIALCMAAGIAMDSLSGSRIVSAPASAAALLAASLLFYTYTRVPSELQQIRQIDSTESAALGDIAAIEALGAGRAACQMLDLCYWAKSAFEMDFFYFGQKLKTGAAPETACEDVFEHRDFALVQLENNPKARAKLPSRRAPPMSHWPSACRIAGRHGTSLPSSPRLPGLVGRNFLDMPVWRGRPLLPIADC